jgi:hypothetical protein
VSTPDQLSTEYIVERWPRLFHMAEAGSWESIKTQGLLSTTALLDRFAIDGPRRLEIESQRRPESLEIGNGTSGRVWIRDNKPINETALRRTLQGMTLEEWYRTLNDRVFFWLTRRRLDKLRSAAAYRDRRHDILTVDTAALMNSHGDAVELCNLNSGAVHAAADYPAELEASALFPTTPG